jgi:hypothetical protein
MIGSIVIAKEELVYGRLDPVVFPAGSRGVVARAFDHNPGRVFVDIDNVSFTFSKQEFNKLFEIVSPAPRPESESNLVPPKYLIFAQYNTYDVLSYPLEYLIASSTSLDDAMSLAEDRLAQPVHEEWADIGRIQIARWNGYEFASFAVLSEESYDLDDIAPGFEDRFPQTSRPDYSGNPFSNARGWQLSSDGLVYPAGHRFEEGQA